MSKLSGRPPRPPSSCSFLMTFCGNVRPINSVSSDIYLGCSKTNWTGQTDTPPREPMTDNVGCTLDFRHLETPFKGWNSNTQTTGTANKTRCSSVLQSHLTFSEEEAAVIKAFPILPILLLPCHIVLFPMLHQSGVL